MSTLKNKTASCPLIIYHHPCMDGFTAAWTAWLKYPNAEFYQGVHGEPPPLDRATGRIVYLLDFSYKYAALLELYHAAEDIVVLDHHASAELELAPLFMEGKLGGEFNMSKSGARLAWEWFFPREPVPALVQLIEDRDLWRFALSHSRELNAAIASYDYSFEQWSELNDRLEMPVDLEELVTEGRAILRKQERDVRELTQRLLHSLWFGRLGLHIQAVNLPYTLASEAGNALSVGVPFVATYYFDGEQYVFSLRSQPDGDDVSGVAARYGGGGHKHAAGFRVRSLEDL